MLQADGLGYGFISFLEGYRQAALPNWYQTVYHITATFASC